MKRIENGNTKLGVSIFYIFLQFFKKSNQLTSFVLVLVVFVVSLIRRRGKKKKKKQIIFDNPRFGLRLFESKLKKVKI